MLYQLSYTPSAGARLLTGEPWLRKVVSALCNNGNLTKNPTLHAEDQAASRMRLWPSNSRTVSAAIGLEKI